MFSFVLLCAILLSFSYVRGAVAHWDIQKTTIIAETCYLVGYPSRTKCGVSIIKEVTQEQTNAHHIALLNPQNQVVIIHKPGHADHDQVEVPAGGEHLQRTKLVYTNCDECS